MPAETAVLVGAGCLEGAVLGLAQGLVMHRAHPAISVARWSAATAVGGGAAWLTAMGGVALIQSAVGDLLRVAALGVLGVVLLLTIGVVQWWLLRTVVPAAWRWIPATAAAWIAGLLVFTGVTTPLWQPGQPVGLIVAIGQSISILIPPNLQNEEDEVLARIKAGERVDHYETKRMARSGKVLDVSLTVSPIYDQQHHVIGGAEAHQALAALDITERAIAAHELDPRVALRQPHQPFVKVVVAVVDHDRPEGPAGPAAQRAQAVPHEVQRAVNRDQDIHGRFAITDAHR